MTKLRLWPCKDIDFSWSDIRFAIRQCFALGNPRTSRKGLLDSAHSSLFCISVRAAFDLYLASRGWGRGDECLFVGVNVRDMYQIAQFRGVRAVSADIDPLTTEVDVFQLRERISQNTRCIVVPHLFGCRICLSAVFEIANSHGIEVVEDCAQAFAGTIWSGSEGAALSLFSFGPLKTATALQGGIAIVRDPTLFKSMNHKLNSYPVQSTWRYFARIVRFSAMRIATHRLIYGMFVHSLRCFRVDHEAVIHASTKSAKSGSFERCLRMKPCAALVRVIQHQVANSDDDIQCRIKKGTELVGAIGEAVKLVLRDRGPNVYWMVPVLVNDSDKFKDTLRREGYDAMSGRLHAIEEVDAVGAEMVENAVMLPFSPRMSDAELQRLGALVTEYAVSGHLT